MSLPKQHALNLLLNKHLSKNVNPHQLLLGTLTFRQCQKLKNHVVNSNDCLNSLFSSFNSLHKEISSSFHLVDNFSDCFSFHTVNCRDKDVAKAYLQNLNRTIEDFCIDPETIIIIFDASIKNNVITSISHVCSHQNILAKTIHYAINITSTEVELFTIRCGINQAIHIQNVHHIFVITDAIHSAR